MLVAESLGFFRYAGDFLYLLNRSPKSQTFDHQHIWSPTSVTNINVTRPDDSDVGDIVMLDHISTKFLYVFRYEKLFESSSRILSIYKESIFEYRCDLGC